MLLTNQPALSQGTHYQLLGFDHLLDDSEKQVPYNDQFIVKATAQEQKVSGGEPKPHLLGSHQVSLLRSFFFIFHKAPPPAPTPSWRWVG